MTFNLGGFSPLTSVKVTGSSPDGFADAARNGVAIVRSELGEDADRIMVGFEVVEQGGVIKDGVISEFQVTIEVFIPARPVRFPR